MMKQMNQPTGPVAKSVNKQSIARHFGIKQKEICYAQESTPLNGYKVLYDPSRQRSFMLPEGIEGVVTGLSSTGVLTYSLGTLNLAELAVEREEYVKTSFDFRRGFISHYSNEIVCFEGVWYRYTGEFPVHVSMNSSPRDSGSLWTKVSYYKLEDTLQSVSDKTYGMYETSKTLGLIYNDASKAESNRDLILGFIAKGGKSLTLVVDKSLYIAPVVYGSNTMALDNLIIKGTKEGVLYLTPGEYFTVNPMGNYTCDTNNITCTGIDRGAHLVTTKFNRDTQINSVYQCGNTIDGYVRVVLHSNSNIAQTSAGEAKCSTIKIDNNTYKNTDDAMVRLINVAYDTLSVKGNTLSNAKGTFLFDNVVNESTNFWDVVGTKQLATVDGNTLINPFGYDATPSNRETSYVALVVAKNFRINYVNNFVKIFLY